MIKYSDQNHYYGMKVRGFAIGNQPLKGLLEIQEPHPDSPYYDILVYSRRLEQKELDEYDLDDLERSIYENEVE